MSWANSVRRADVCCSCSGETREIHERCIYAELGMGSIWVHWGLRLCVTRANVCKTHWEEKMRIAVEKGTAKVLLNLSTVRKRGASHSPNVVPRVLSSLAVDLTTAGR